jgi:predicted nucleotidyltransferase
MTPELPPLIQRAVRRLIRAFAPERILVFGSCAKGTMHEGSDIDLLVIATVCDNRRSQQRRARQLTADCFPTVDVVLATPEEVAAADQLESPFLYSILGSGITIYDGSCRSNGVGSNSGKRFICATGSIAGHLEIADAVKGCARSAAGNIN